MTRLSILEKSHDRKDTQRSPSSNVVEFALDPAITNEHSIEDGNGIRSEDPPEGGYGWVVCGAVSLINGFTWGVAAVC